jgi:hypothetical protein
MLVAAQFIITNFAITPKTWIALAEGWRFNLWTGVACTAGAGEITYAR